MSSKALTPFSAFQHELVQREAELSSILPSHIDPVRFRNASIIAIKDNPNLLKVDRRSLHQALTEAAEDGLHPDGREGVITIYREKRKRRNENGAWIEEVIEVANWNPMLFGVRKRAREVCGMIIDAEIVHERDRFVRRGGDNPLLEHEPPMLGQDRGKPVGAYAIFRQGDQVLHREVMDAQQIADVRGQSRQKDGLMWTKFWTEAWKKSVVRRGIKTVPSVPEFERVIKREDRDFDFDKARSKAVDAIDRPAALKAETIDADGVVIDEIAEPEPGDADSAAGKAPPAADRAPARTDAPQEKDAVLTAYEAACVAASSGDALNQVWQMFERRMPPAIHEEAVTIFEREFARIARGGSNG